MPLCKLSMHAFLSALTVAVFLVEKSGRLLNLEEGRDTVAGTINTIMSENLSLPPVASQVFCVWLISPLLRKYILNFLAFDKNSIILGHSGFKPRT